MNNTLVITSGIAGMGVTGTTASHAGDVAVLVIIIYFPAVGLFSLSLFVYDYLFKKKSLLSFFVKMKIYIQCIIQRCSNVKSRYDCEVAAFFVIFL